jgi:quercetin dioxygenase-like cupin family protein
VRIDPLFEAADPGRVLGVSVTFEPGARTAWHTHPLGQTLIVTAGCGLVQSRGGPIEGKTVDWMEKVSDEQYQAGRAR